MNREPRYPEKSTDVFRISTSSLETYLKCGIRYFLERELGYRRTTVPMAIGTAVAAAARVDNQRKIAMADGSSGLELSKLVAQGVYSYDHQVESKELKETFREIESGRDDAANASRCYGERLSPEIKDVRFAERRIVAEVADGIELAGTPDCITKTAIRDTKTGQPWNPFKVDASRQLTGYDLLFEATLSRSPQRVAIDSLSKRNGKWYSETIWSYRTEEDRTAFIDVLHRAKDGIEAGVALPAPEGAWWCAPKWCQFYGNGCPIHK